MSSNDGRFVIKSPCLFYCSGPSQTGKSTILMKIIENVDKIFDKPVDKIIYCYGIDTGNFPRHDKLVLNDGPPDMKMLEGPEHKLYEGIQIY